MVQHKKKTKELFEFFGITKPLFINKALNGEDIQRFVDRTYWLEYFKAAVQGGNSCAIIGSPGSGKSSFLIKLKEELKKSVYCDYLQFSFPPDEHEKSRLHFLRAILRSILCLIMNEEELLELFDKNEIELERKRLDYSIIIENHSKTQQSINGGFDASIKKDILKMLIPVDVSCHVDANRTQEVEKGETFDFPNHNENTLYDVIVKLTRKLDEPIVLLIDELDKVGRFPLETPEWDKEVIKILELSREIMANEKLVMVFSLQNELYEKLVKAEKGEYNVSILGLINLFEKLDGFDLEFAREAVTRSLEFAGYARPLENLIEKGVLEIILDVVKGNPRLFMTYLNKLYLKAFVLKQPAITLDLLKDHLFALFKEEMTEDRWQELLKKAN